MMADGERGVRSEAGMDDRRPPKGLMTVIGGTGYLGRRIARHLLDDGCQVRVVARNASGAGLPVAERLETVQADITDNDALAGAVAGSQAVVNAVSLYVEKPDLTFEDVHVEGAARLARLCATDGVERLVQVSGIGSDPTDPDTYISARGRGEHVVREMFPGAVLARPAVMFGAGRGIDAEILKPLKTLPAYPLFGDGDDRLQPGHVGDVARAIANAMQQDDPWASYDLAGPIVYRYRDLVRAVAASADIRAHLVSVPYGLWSLAAALAERLPSPPLTRHQLALVRKGNVAVNDGMAALSVSPRRLEDSLREKRAAG